MNEKSRRRPHIGVVVSRFNSEITRLLLDSCLKTLGEGGAESEVTHVPGAFEIPWAASELALSGKFDAVVCLGAVLKGQTPQNDFISSATLAHIQEISIATRVPCVLGVITPNTYEQALARTKGSLNRGAEAAAAALEMAELKIRGLGTKPR